MNNEVRATARALERTGRSDERIGNAGLSKGQMRWPLA